MNASNIKYRNRLKRRVIISRQQLYQPSPFQQPRPPADAVLQRESSVNGNNNHDDSNVINEALINDYNPETHKEARDTDELDAFAGRRRESDGINNDDDDANHGSQNTARRKDNIKGAKKEVNMDSMSSDEGEATRQRAKDIISKRSQRNHSYNAPAASPPRAAAVAANNDYHESLDCSQATPPRRNSNRENAGAMINRYETRGAAVPPRAQLHQPQQNYHQQQHHYNTTTNPPPSKSGIYPTPHHSYRLSPPEGHDEMSTTTSILTDEAMDDRNTMIRNVLNWERRMQMKRQQQQQSKQQVYPQHYREEEEDNIVNLVHEAIAINEGMTKKKSPIRSSNKPSRSTAAATPQQQVSSIATVITPDEKRHATKNDGYTANNAIGSGMRNKSHPPRPPPSDDKELPPSPAPTDHSADAAAGMMFALHGQNNTRKKITSLVKNDKLKSKQMTMNNIASTSLRDANLSKSGRPSTTMPPISSPHTTKGNKSSTTPSSPPHRHQQSHQLDLEQKLGRLANSQPSIATPIHGSSKVSVVSVQPSIESECVRQNAEILLAMEGQMMDFLVAGAVGVESVEDDNGRDGDEEEANNTETLEAEEGKFDTATRGNLSSPPALNDGFNGGGSRSQQDHTFSTLFSLDERDESDDFADPPLISSSSSDSGSRSDVSSRSGSFDDDQDASREYIIAKQQPSSVVKKDKDLGTFFDQLSSLLGVRCALDRDEDSDVFYMNNSQFNTSFATMEFEETNQRQIDRGEVKADNVTRKKRAVHSSESVCGESHTTMLRDNTAQYKEHLAYLSPTLESGPAFQFARHDVSGDNPPDPELSLEMDDDDESDCLPDPETASDVDAGRTSSGRDPPRGIDPEEGEDVLYHNRFRQQNVTNESDELLTLDHVKMSTREKQKGSSLHWQTSNGLILDDKKNDKQVPSFRKSDEVAALASLPSFSAQATILEEHFVEDSEHKLSPNYRRRGVGQLQFIDEVEEDDEDASESSVDEESEGPQYEYEQFMKDFKDVVQEESEANEPEPVEELVVGSISESSSAKDDEELDNDSSRPNTKLQNVTQRREIEAALHRSMRQATYSRHRNFMHHNPKQDAVKSQSEGRQQEPQASTVQPVDRNSVKQLSHQAPYGRQFKRPQPNASKSRLEEKLRDLGAPKKLSGDSVGTSELGSLYSSSAVPKAIFHRTQPPSARSTPSSMQNTVDYSMNAAVVTNQGSRQRVLRPLSPREPPQGRDPSESGHTTDSKNTLGFIPIGSETWKLKHEFLDSSPLDPSPRSNKLAFFPPSIDEASQVSDGFSALKNNSLGSLQVGAETWNLRYNFHSHENRNEPANSPQPQKIKTIHHAEPVTPPTLTRYREGIPSRHPIPVRRNDSNSSHPPKKLIMKSTSEIRDGTRVQTLHFVGGEDNPSPKPVSQRFQGFPSAKKVAKSAPSPRPQAITPVAKRNSQPPQRQTPGTGRRHYIPTQANAVPSRPPTKKSLEDNLRRIDPPSKEIATLAEASQVSGSVFEAVEVGSFGVQHTLFSKWDRPKDPPQQQPAVGVSYISTYKGPQAVDGPGSNRNRFKYKMKAITTRASQKHKL